MIIRPMSERDVTLLIRRIRVAITRVHRANLTYCPGSDRARIAGRDEAIDRLYDAITRITAAQCADCGEIGSCHPDCWSLADHSPVRVPTMEDAARRLLHGTPFPA